MTFEDLGLEPSTLKAVAESGYTEPTPIQAKAIPIALMGRDVMGIAQTGTGKTASFTLPMIDILSSGRSKARMPRALILCPTRELAAQAADNFTNYSKYSDLSMALIIGGTSFTDQEKALDRTCDVLIATPGRLLDLFERGKILLNDVKYFVIDEADRMLDMGFIPDVERIAKLVPQLRQTLFFSATMDKQIRRLSEAFLMNPKEVAVDAPATTATTITQALIKTTDSDKRDALRKLLRAENIENGFVFCNRKKDVDILYKSLTKHGFKAVALHGDMAQSKRMEMLAAFKTGNAGLLICSDVAARGLDVAAVPFVVNFDVPNNAEDYVHRIGRTGRAGMQGKAFTLSVPADSKMLVAIEKLIGGPIPPIGTKPAPQPPTAVESVAEEQKSEPAKVASETEVATKETPAKQETQKAPAEAQKPTAVEKSTKKAEPSVKQDTPKPVAEEERAKPAAEEERPKSAAKGERPKRQRRDRGRHDPDVGVMDHGEDVLAFGAHTPSFLKAEPYVIEPAEQKIS
ncbi:MAG: DEAD/DEAH box helicase [Alphaproteobacteria bacterium]|nr:DEAD/DEAH box helicase [Alphaproteobacteria bacterium]